MMVSAYRITQSKYIATAFDGEGARLNGGRWNSPGTRMVYVAGSRSLATLEILVHFEDLSAMEGLFSIIPVEIPRNIILRKKPNDLPPAWNSPQPIALTQQFGDQWIQDKRSAVLEVPSAITNEESNYLLNPAHADFSKIEIRDALPFRIDSRL